MEQFNRIELRGIVGSVKLQDYSGRQMARINVATSRAYKDKNGAAVIETTWHSVQAWEGSGIKDLDKIEKGSKIYVRGRLREQKYTGIDDVERTSYDVVANSITIIDLEEPLQYEM